jgi:biopolymer transport protein ExbD
MGMSVGDKNSGGMLAEINVTPLVDVMLVLIIIFMVVSQALATGVTVDLPKASSAEESRDVGQNINVAIASDESLFVERTQTDLDGLIEQLNVEYERDGARGLLIKGDKGLTWKQVRAVMDKVNENGMSTMLLAVQKEEE